MYVCSRAVVSACHTIILPTNVTCHGNFGSVVILVRDQNSLGKLVRTDQFLFEKKKGPGKEKLVRLNLHV